MLNVRLKESGGLLLTTTAVGSTEEAVMQDKTTLLGELKVFPC